MTDKFTASISTTLGQIDAFDIINRNPPSSWIWIDNLLLFPDEVHIMSALWDDDRKMVRINLRAGCQEDIAMLLIKLSQ